MFLADRKVKKIYLSCKTYDMRKQIDGLVAIVVDAFNQQPTTGDIFIFRGKGKNKVKLLCWDRNGFILSYKRLEKLLPYNINPDTIGANLNQPGTLQCLQAYFF